MTSEKGVVNPVRSGSGVWQWMCCQEFLKNFLFLKNHQTQPTFIKLTCSVQASQENKSLLWCQSQHISKHLPDFSEGCFCSFYTFLCIFWKNEFEIWFPLVFFNHMTKRTSDCWSTPLNAQLVASPIFSASGMAHLLRKCRLWLEMEITYCIYGLLYYAKLIIHKHKWYSHSAVVFFSF